MLAFMFFNNKLFNVSFKPHVPKMGPQGPKYNNFWDQFYPENARKFRFHVFLHFHTKKHMIWWYYLKWSEFTRNCDCCFNLMGFPWTHKWNEIHNFLWIRPTLGKNMVSNIFSMKMGGILKSELSAIFQLKLFAKNIVFGLRENQHRFVFAVWCLILKKKTFWANLLDSSVFLVK